MKKFPKAIFIGVKQVGDWLEKARTDLDFLPSFETISDFWEALSNETISNDIQIVFIMDTLFDPNGEDQEFEQFIAQMSPYCLMCIVNYKQEHRTRIQERIENQAYTFGNQEELIYYFIEKKQTNRTIDDAIEQYKRAPNRNKEVAAIINGEDPSQINYQEEEQEDYTYQEPVETDEFDDGNNYLGQVLAVTSSKGGSGKSTVAVSVATYLAQASMNSVKEGLEERPLKIMILDLDVRDGQLGFLTGNTKPTVLKIRLDGVSKQSIENTTIHSSRLGCDLLLAPKRPRHSDDTPPEFYVELIQTLKKMYDYVILDTSVNYLDPLLEKVAYPIADQILFVTDIVVNSVYSMTRWINEVTTPKENHGMGIKKEKIAIVVNKALAGVNMDGNRIQKSALGLPIIAAIPSNPKIIAHAANLNSMNIIIRHEGIEPMIRKIATSIVGKKYKLSKTRFSKKR